MILDKILQKIGLEGLVMLMYLGLALLLGVLFGIAFGGILP